MSCFSFPKSDINQGEYGVSVFGRLLFSIYMPPLGQLMRKLGLEYYFYADDIHFYISSQSDVSVSLKFFSN